MAGAVIGMVAFILPIVCVSLVVVVQLKKEIQKIDARLGALEVMLKEKKM